MGRGAEGVPGSGSAQGMNDAALLARARRWQGALGQGAAAAVVVVVDAGCQAARVGQRGGVVVGVGVGVPLLWVGRVQDRVDGDERDCCSALADSEAARLETTIAATSASHNRTIERTRVGTCIIDSLNVPQGHAASSQNQRRLT